MLSPEVLDLRADDVAAGKETKDAAWYYPEPLEKATHLKDYVAFCKSRWVITNVSPG